MSGLLRTLFSIALAAVCVGSWAQTAPKSAPAASSAVATHMAAMDSQMKTMREMHAKMVSAKTPEARSALMAEHMKTMQEGMAMMGMPGGPGMGGMGAMQGGKPMPGDMNQRQQMMEKRMDMMQMMMQMMMDRMPPPAGK